MGITVGCIDYGVSYGHWNDLMKWIASEIGVVDQIIKVPPLIRSPELIAGGCHPLALLLYPDIDAESIDDFYAGEYEEFISPENCKVVADSLHELTKDWGDSSPVHGSATKSLVNEIIRCLELCVKTKERFWWAP